MARQAKPPRRPRQQPTGNAIGVHPADRRLWQRGRVRRARPPCCWTPTTSPGPNHLCGLCQLLHRGQHRGSDGELLRFPERSVRRPAHEDGVLALVKKRRGGDLDCGPTFNLLRGTNVLRNLSVAGALTASYQNLDDTILIESDSYARSETYTQLETGAAITSAIDALCPNSKTKRRSTPSSPRPWCPTGTKGKCQASWPASSPTTPRTAR